MKKFKEACEDIIWSDDGVSDTSSTYCSLAKRYHMPIGRVKKQFKYHLENANAQMALYGFKDDMTSEEIDKEITQINTKIFQQLNRK